MPYIKLESYASSVARISRVEKAFLANNIFVKMKLVFSHVCVILFIITCVSCQQENSTTASNQFNLTETLFSNVSVEILPLWCPDGYGLLNVSDKWLHACKRQSCPGTKSIDIKKCIKTDKTLQNCAKMYLTDDQYKIDDDTGSLVDFLHNTSVELGLYVIEFTKAIICDPKWNDTSIEPSNRAELPKWCMPMKVSKGGYKNVSGRLFIHSISRPVELFKVDPDETAHICPYMDPMFTNNCGSLKMGQLPGHDFQVLPDWGIKHTKNILKPKVYPHGHYVLYEDKSHVMICFLPDKPTSNAVFYVYGVASSLSAFCLLLVLLTHLFYPVLNYHAKSLLCLAFSFMIMYVAMAVRFLAGNIQSETSNVVLFAVQYISSLGAFFWLSILSFELWRIFAILRGTINSRDSALKKRIFIAKCVYAWGIPTVLCIVAIDLSYKPDVQISLGLDLNFQSINWFYDIKTMLIMFYTPIIIVLIENVLFFVLTVVNLRKASNGTELLNAKISKKLFRVYFKLFLVLGFCWFFEIISWLSKHNTGPEPWYFTDVINCLQGVLIFIIYIFKKKTMMIIKNKFGCITTSQMNTNNPMAQKRVVKMDALSLQKIQRNEPMEPGALSVESRKLIPSLQNTC